MKFPVKDRRTAGRELALALQEYGRRDDLLILALPRGGVPVADEVARELGAPLDVLLVRKLGVPWHRELAMGAIASGGARVLNEDLVRDLGIGAAEIARVESAERAELERRALAYRGDRPWPSLAGRCVLLVDDGVATGATMEAAIRAVRQQQPARLVVAVPVAPPDTVRSLRRHADALVCLAQPEPFMAVGVWYQDFTHVGDDQVREILARAWQREAASVPATSGSPGS